ncbi:MAG: Flp pilus assembly protein CpaB [Armatimonadota bacterium]|nr:Flp pilus assembly protein CpaB [Armatimonadota bacterium]MCX7777663.1 Flp pilus assembly protein CpaB [Armatimonadota bacterium]MDW8025909.1 Flp pilus assembly protein CpaB [Armatimonadota bacterium]
MARTLVVGIVLVVLLTFITFVYLRMRQPKPTKVEVPQVDVVVASTYIPPGRPILPRHVELVRMQATHVPQDAVRKIDEAIMRMPLQPISRGDVIRKSILLVPGSIARGYQVPIGERAVAIYVRAHNSTADVVMPGDIVDVFAIYEFTDESGNRRTRSSLLAQAVRVLAVDEIVETGEATPVRMTESGTQQPQGAAEQPESRVAQIGRKPQVTMRRVVLSVTPIQAQKILGAAHAENTRLDIAIRNEADMSLVPVVEAAMPKAATPQRRVSQPSVGLQRRREPKAKPMPFAITPPVAPVHTITVYRGTQREEVIVTE